MVRFERPSGPLNVWSEVDGFEVLKDQTKKPVKYSVQEVPDTPERRQEVIDLMYNDFLGDEAMSKCLKIKEDPNGVEDFKTMWCYGLDQGVTVGCYKLDSDGKIGELIGANVVFMVTDETSKDFAKLKAGFKSKNFMKIWEFFESLMKKCDVMKLYGVDKFISSICLCVKPSYRGHKLGVYMLDGRREMAKKYGYTATCNMFTVPTSQKQAARAGFEDGLVIEYKDALDADGNPIFPGIESPCVKLMMRRLP